MMGGWTTIRGAGRGWWVGGVLANNWALSGLSVLFVVFVAALLFAHGVRPGHLAITISFLLTVVAVALVWGRLPAIVAALASALAFNYLFIPPTFAFSAPTSEEGVLVLGLLAVAVVLGSLAEHVRTIKRELRELAASEKLQKTLLSVVSHDLKTPLTTILGSLNSLLVEEEFLDERSRRELVTIAHDQAKRLNRLVNGVLDMTRLEAGAVRLRLEPAPMVDIIQGALAQLQDASAERRYHVHLPEGLPTVSVDSVLLSTALANLLDNAAKFSAPDTTIDVGAQAEDEQVLLSVADRGPGIATGEHGRIFEKFYRSRESGPPGGSGLGLAIAKAIVEAHGGRIWAEARAGGGTALKMNLPLLRER